MKRNLLYSLLIIYLIFVVIDFLEAFEIIPLLPSIIIKLTFVFGCLVWIHIDRQLREVVDFNLVRVFLISMFITDIILGTLAKINGGIGRMFFTMGIISATFGHLAIIFRHLRLVFIDRIESIAAINLNGLKRVAICYFSLFFLMEAFVVFLGLMVKEVDPFSLLIIYFLISLASLAASFLYLLFSKNQLNSRIFAFTGLGLLIVSDIFIALEESIFKGTPYLEPIIWGLYAPMLLFVGASIVFKSQADSPDEIL